MSDTGIPAQDGPAREYMLTFANVIAFDPSVYQLQQVDSDAISAAVNAYSAAYTLAIEPATRTELTIIDKDETRNSAEQIVRLYAMQIKYNAGISTAAKAAIGVSQPNPERNPINVPASSPLMNIIGATPGAQTVRYADTSAPDSGAKPFGAASLQLFVAITDEPTTDEAVAKFYGAFTRNPIGVAFNEADDGKVATYFARWADRKGQVGPWSLPVSMRIAA
ncbi:MAG TPA: hypothetical protein VGR35_23095 [Tepidisphaeraceae bacterium]|nr:hypothetical protein [Tepidisphaeraceae bacterium]